MIYIYIRSDLEEQGLFQWFQVRTGEEYKRHKKGQKSEIHCKENNGRGGNIVRKRIEEKFRIN